MKINYPVVRSVAYSSGIIMCIGVALNHFDVDAPRWVWHACLAATNLAKPAFAILIFTKEEK